MRKFTHLALGIVGILCFAQHSNAQDTAYLYLFTTGSGSISPYQNGQLLDVGVSYEMTATPDPGYEFSSWQPVSVFTDTTILEDQNGNTVTNVSMGDVPVNEYFYTPDLTFTMESQTLFAGTNDIETETTGWQANFVVAVPEPSEALFITGGFTSLALFQVVRTWKKQNKIRT